MKKKNQQFFKKLEKSEKITHINYSNMNITDVKKLTELLLKLESSPKINDILSIDLSNNKLSSFPKNLKNFKNLTSLNISNNKFENYKELGESLQTLPSLSELFVDLLRKEDALVILESLPKLKFLNGQSTLYNDNINSNNSSAVKGEEIKNKSENKIIDLNQANEIYQSKNQNNEYVGNYIKEVIIEDGESSSSGNNNKNHSNKNSSNINEAFNIENVNSSQLKECYNIPKEDTLEGEIPNYDTILQKIIVNFKNTKEKKTKFYLDFQTQLKNQIEKINKLSEEQVPNYLYIANICKAKNELYLFLKKEVILAIKGQKIINNNALLSSMLSDIETYQEKINKKLFDTITNLCPILDEKVSKLKNINDKSQKDIESKIDTIKLNNLKLKENEILINQIKNENELLKKNNKLLDCENKNLTKKLIEKAKNIVISNIQENGNEKGKEITKEKEISEIKEKDNLFALHNTLVKQKSESSLIIRPTKPKNITRKILLDIINEIYKSKTNSNKKNFENNLPKETMEQHMYTFLKKKYGLNYLVIEWAATIINGIKLYSKVDSQICIFGKLLRNEIEENIIYIIEQLKTSLNDLILCYLQEKGNISMAEINEIIANITNNKEYLTREMWESISIFLFNNNDKNIFINFMQKVEIFIKQKISTSYNLLLYDGNSNCNSATLRRVSSEERILFSQIKGEQKILYKDFFNLILRYQIKLRSKYLRKFISLFREVDTDCDGIINDEQFHLLFQKCNLFYYKECKENVKGDYCETNNDNKDFEDNFERLIRKLDYGNNNAIIFSDVVEMFEKESYNNSNISFMEKIISF